MIPADQLELISAAVDGELSVAELRAFRRVLDNSSEARVLYAKLKTDRDRVRSFPQVSPPVDLGAKILARIASVAPAPVASPVKVASKPGAFAHPAPARATDPSRRMPSWVPVAVAAGLLLCVTAGSYAFFNTQPSGKTAIAKHPWSNALPAPQDAPVAVPSPTAPPRDTRPDPAAVVRVDVSPVPPLPLPHPIVPEAVAVAPEPRPAQHDLIASPLLPKIPPFDFAQLRMPFLRSVVELDREDIRQELTDELGRGSPAFRFDLFVRDTARGAEVFQNAAKAAGLSLFTDAATLEKLKLKQAVSVVVYTDALTAAELTDLFAKVCSEDTKFSPRVCDSLHVIPAVRADEHELKNVLGLDAGLFKRPRTGSNGTGQGGEKNLLDKNGEPKSVSAGTIDSVTKALTNPPAKAAEKPAVMMTWQAVAGVPLTNPALSSELKQYLAKRGDRKPSAVPAIIIIRLVG